MFLIVTKMIDCRLVPRRVQRRRRVQLKNTKFAMKAPIMNRRMAIRTDLLVWVRKRGMMIVTMKKQQPVKNFARKKRNVKETR